MRLLLTRPQSESDVLAKILIDLGHAVVIEPLLSIEPVDQVNLEFGNPQAIIVTSVNGARAFASNMQTKRYRNTPLFAVGSATAEALDGFNVVHVGEAGVAAMTKELCNSLNSNSGPLLYVRGVHVAGNLAEDLRLANFTIEQLIVYEAVEKTTLSPDVVEQLESRHIDGVVLFSPRTAAVFSRLIVKAELVEKMDRMTFYCLSQNVSDNILFDRMQDEDQVVIAETPTLPDLIEAITVK